MANPTFNARDAAGKPYNFVFHDSNFAAPGPDREGLVKHASINPEVQVQILALVDETGSASLDDCIVALDGHPAPVTAVLALVDAGYLVLEPGTLSETLRVSRSSTVQDFEVGAGGVEAPKGSGRDRRLSTALSEKAAASLKGSVVAFPGVTMKLTGSPLRPEVFVLSLDDLSDVRPGGFLDRPVVYLALAGNHAYVGMSGKGSGRVRGGHLAQYDTLVAIADASGTMTRELAAVAERILGLTVDGMDDYVLDATIPHGGACTRSEYESLRIMIGEALILVRNAGIAFDNHAPRDLLAGPIGAAEHVDGGAPSGDGELRTLEAVGIAATAIEDNGDWVVRAGSEVRVDPVLSAGAVVANLRWEFDYAGILVRQGRHYRLTRDLRFASATAAGNFVTGSKHPNKSGWLPPANTLKRARAL